MGQCNSLIQSDWTKLRESRPWKRKASVSTPYPESGRQVKGAANPKVAAELGREVERRIEGFE